MAAFAHSLRHHGGDFKYRKRISQTETTKTTHLFLRATSWKWHSSKLQNCLLCLSSLFSVYLLFIFLIYLSLIYLSYTFIYLFIYFYSFIYCFTQSAIRRPPSTVHIRRPFPRLTDTHSMQSQVLSAFQSNIVTGRIGLKFKGFLFSWWPWIQTCIYKDNKKTGKKAIGLDWQNNDFARASRIFSCRHCTTAKQNCLASPFQEDAEDVNVIQPFFDPFFFKLRYSPLADIWQIGRHGIIAMNFETAWFHFLRDVFANLRNRTRGETANLVWQAWH